MNQAQAAAWWGGVLIFREKRKLGPAVSPGWEGPAGNVVNASPRGPITSTIRPTVYIRKTDQLAVRLFSVCEQPPKHLH